MSNGKKIVENILSLSVAEFASKGLQALFYLYLARVLGKEGLGSLGFAQSFTAYFVLLVKLGFDTVGTRAIAKKPDNLIRIVNNIISIRTMLAFVVFGLLVIIVLFMLDPLAVQKFTFENKLIIIVSGLNIFAFAYLLNWVYIGIERMKVVAVRTVAVNITNVIGILLLVKDSDDVLIAISIMAASNLLTSLYLYLYYRKEFGKIKWNYDKEQWSILTKQSISIGLIFFIITIYNNLDITMLRLMIGEAETGIYEAAHRILLLSVVFSGAVQNGFFPEISRLAGIQLDKSLDRFKKLLFLPGVSLSVFIFVFAEYLTILITDEFVESVLVLKVLSITAFLIFVNISFFSPLVAWGYEKKVFIGNLTGLIFNVALNFLLIPKYGAVGAAIATISTEIGVLMYVSYLYYQVRKKLDLKNLPPAIIVAVLSFLPGVFLISIDTNPIISILICIILLIIFTLLFKIIKIEEIKAVFKK